MFDRKKTRKLSSTNQNVWKFIFEGADAIVEAVLYRYPDFKTRTVICCSVMSGCPIGCSFCLTPGQQVDTPTGPTPFDSLSVGDTVNGPSGPNRVVEVMDRDYSGDTFRFEFFGGRVIEVTADHPMVLSDGTTKEARYVTMEDDLMESSHDTTRYMPKVPNG